MITSIYDALVRDPQATLLANDIYSWFSRSSEAKASELRENLEEMFPRHMHVEIFNSTTVRYLSS